MGLIEAETELAMMVRLDAVTQPAPPDLPLSISRVTTATDLRAFAEITASHWSPPDTAVLEYYDRASSALLGSEAPQWLYLGRVDGLPVATAEATAGGGVLGLYNISTRAAWRGHRIGSAMTYAPLLDGRAAGFPTAILQAAAEGVGVYRRLGFTPFGTVTEFKPG